MRDIDIKKKIEIFLTDNQIIMGLVAIVIGFLLYQSTITPMSYKPMFLSIISSDNDGTITNITKNEDGYNTVIVDFKAENQEIDRRTTKTNQALQIGDFVKVKEFPLKKDWFIVEGDQWNANFVLPLAILIFGVIIFIPSAKQKLAELKLFVHGQVTVANLVSREQGEKGKYVLEYEFLDNKKEKQHIQIIKQSKGDIEKSVKILYLDDKPNKFIVVRKDYDVDLYRI